MCRTTASVPQLGHTEPQPPSVAETWSVAGVADLPVDLSLFGSISN